MMRRLSVAWSVVWASLACSGAAPTPAAATAAPRVAAQPAQVAIASLQTAPTEAHDQDGAAEQSVAQALGYISALRKLPATGPVKARVLSRDQMVERVEQELDTEVPPAVVSASGEILFAFGAVPASFDYRRGLLEVMRSELLGFYEPRERTMFLGGDLRGAELDATLWHELVHALQDQHYGLEKLLTFSADAGDWQGAVHALAEGDATSAMLDALFAPKGLRAPDVSDFVLDLEAALSTGSVQQVPAIIKRSMIAPYVDGLAFVNALRRRGGWESVDAVWKRMPTSTEQILHLDKYDAHEDPEPLPALVATASSPARLTYSDVYGEESLRILFEEWMPAKAAREAASAWAGDRISAFSDDQGTSVAWRIRFDADAAALRALHAFARGVLMPEDQSSDGRGRLPEFLSGAEAERASRSGHACRERHIRGPMAVLRRGRELAVTLGPFRRNSRSAVSEGSCVGALDWAAALLKPAKL